MITYGSVDGVKIIGTSEQYNKYKKSLEKQRELLKKQNKELSRELDKFRPFSCSYNMVREIKRLNNNINKVVSDMEDIREKNNYYDDYKIDSSILTYWIDILKGEQE